MVNNGGNIAKLADKLSDERHAALITSDISRRYFCGFEKIHHLLRRIP